MTPHEYVSEQLDRRLETPDMWGTPESVEDQILLLLEVRAVMADDDPALVHEKYTAFLTKHFGRTKNTLSRALGLTTQANAEFSALLHEFVSGL